MKTAIRIPTSPMAASPRSLMILTSPPTLSLLRTTDPPIMARAKTRRL